MTLDPSLRRELEGLIDALCEDSLDAAGEARLSELISGTPGALEHYLLAMELHANLIWDYALRPGMVSDATSASQREPAEPADAATESSSADPAPPKSPVLGFLGDTISFVVQSRTFFVFCVVAGFGLASLFAWRQFGARQPQDVAQQKPDQQSGDEDSSPDDSESRVVAWLTRAVNCQWTQRNPGPGAPRSGSLPVGAEFSAGESIDLTAGLAELTFDSGAKVIVEGPVRFSFVSELGGDLAHGKLTAVVPHTAKGFTVTTPESRVVDRGTEFGIKVEAGRSTYVVVYAGSVDVQSTGKTADQKTQTPVNVKEGQSVVVKPATAPEAAPPADEHFVRDLSPPPEPKGLEASYVALVKKLKPVVWYRLDGKNTDRLLHDETGHADAKLFWKGEGNPFTKGVFGQALWLGGDQLKDYAVATEYPQSGDGRLTVCAWAYAESRPGYATVAANWREKYGGGQFHLGLFDDVDGRSFDLGVKVTQSDGSTCNLREGKKHLFPLFQWQHVAFTTDSKRLTLYRQGKQVAAKKQNGFNAGQVKALGVGVTFNEAGNEPGPSYPGWWEGKVDEVMIFNDCLSADAVRELAEYTPR